MPPPLLRPFPYLLHVGTDICHVGRIAAILRQPLAARLIRRLLAPVELDHANPELLRVLLHVPEITAPPPAPDETVLLGGGSPRGRRRTREQTGAAYAPLHPWVYSRAAQYLAGRFAAKEAVIKAHPHLSLTFHTINILPASALAKLKGPEVCPESSRNPASAQAPMALLRFSRKGKDAEQIARVSISHDAQFATATCIGYEDEPARPEMSKRVKRKPRATKPAAAQPETMKPETTEAAPTQTEATEAITAQTETTEATTAQTETTEAITAQTETTESATTQSERRGPILKA
ncbi:hypothetical protein C8A05DRAFT_29821 [Staphylotrichum tortipilum]|uniref:4'-phosphopantetheinyl transferase domain-containing protein n=1 Tax=Staphylotrichum tortipilum TaxID=2831512 RepID=A0AAN6RXQ4_9PEZI|nr:hypothetical protein C8A05DRAFT_29821 [Staphylotrichum longicolle]